MKVYQEGANDVIITDFGLRVTYDLVYHITVSVPGNYRGRTCGLCGNFNSDKADDFQLPDGNLTKDLQTFGAAWKLSVPGVFCEDGCGDEFCPKCDESKISALEAKCAVITDPRGPFAPCHSVIDPESYFRDCVYDVCMAKDEQSMLCHSIAAYMLDCQDFGAKTQKWRSPSFCRESVHFIAISEICASYLHVCSFIISNSCSLFFFFGQHFNALPTAIMISVCSPVPLHVLVSLILSHATQLVRRAVPVIRAITSMELAVCPLTNAAVTTVDIHLR